MKKTDEQLVKDYLDGDKDVFNEIVNRYLKLVYKFVYRLIGNEKEAEDISQVIFLKTWKNIRKFDTEKTFKTWIFSIAKNTSIDYLRKRKDIPMSLFDNEQGGNVIEDNLTSEEPDASEIFSLAQDKNQVQAIMNKLSIIQKEVIILKYVNEMSLSEIAVILDIPVDTAKSHHRRALIKMRSLLLAPKLSK